MDPKAPSLPASSALVAYPGLALLPASAPAPVPSSAAIRARLAARRVARADSGLPHPSEVAAAEKLPQTAEEFRAFASSMHWQGVLYSNKDETTSYFFYMAERLATSCAKSLEESARSS